jgi:hypothetical protein
MNATLTVFLSPLIRVFFAVAYRAIRMYGANFKEIAFVT